MLMVQKIGWDVRVAMEKARESANYVIARFPTLFPHEKISPITPPPTVSEEARLNEVRNSIKAQVNGRPRSVKSSRS